jgi:putative phosphoribosyl transferase
MIQLPFADRASAGAALADELVALHYQDPVVFALPRGGVPVAAPIARALKAPLDILLVRKIGVPWQPEFAAGSIIDGERPDIIMNEDVMRATGVKQSEIDAIAKRELLEIERRRALYAPGRKPLSAKGKTAILVDDGIATGASMRAAIAGVRRREPLRIVVAVPVAPPDTVAELRRQADEVICLAEPEPFGAVGYFYRDFHQLEDSEVIPLLAEAYAPPASENS